MGIWGAKRRPALAWAAILYLALLVPVSNMVWGGFQVLISPRFLYLPSIAVAWIVADLLPERAGWRRTVPVALAGLACVGMAARTVVRCGDFLTSERFWGYELARNPESLDAIRYHAKLAAERGQPLVALQLTSRGHDVAKRWYSHTGSSAEFVMDAVEQIAELIPDHDRKSMKSVAKFCDTILVRKEKVARLQALGFALDVPVLEGKGAAALRSQEVRVRALRADVASRMGDDEQSMRESRLVEAACPGVSAGRLAVWRWFGRGTGISKRQSASWTA